MKTGNSLQWRLTVFLVAALTLPALIVAWVSYGLVHDIYQTERVKSVGRVADARREQLRMVFQREIARADAFLLNLQHRCGANGVRADCARNLLDAFVQSEAALGALLTLSDRASLNSGRWPVTRVEAAPMAPEQIARMSDWVPGAERSYVVMASDAATGTKLHIRYSVRVIQPIFAPHPDLGKSGENFLADRNGFFATSAMYPAVQGHGHPISAIPMRRCLSPENAETLDLDYRDAPIIHGFRYITELGGGCIMAHIDQAEAFAPIQALRGNFALGMLALTALALLLARFSAVRIARPIDNLTRVTHRIAAGELTLRAPPSGGAEIAALASAFNSMTEQLVERSAGLEREVRERTESLQLMSSAFQRSTEAMLISDADNRIVMVNDAFCHLTGYTQADVRGQDPRMFSAGDTDPQIFEQMWRGLRERGFWEGELWDRRKSGSPYVKWVSIAVVRDTNGNPNHYIATYSDITARKESEQRLVYLAHHDSLTGLPNRLNLSSRLFQILSFAKRNATHVALMLLDLDGFKAVNDSLGHHVGDQLLIEVGGRLQACVRSSDLVARLGGDEFVVVTADVEHPEDVSLIAQSMVLAISAPYQLNGVPVLTTPSVGIAIYPNDGGDMDALLRCADAAMYFAKNRGSGKVQFYGQLHRQGETDEPLTGPPVEQKTFDLW